MPKYDFRCDNSHVTERHFRMSERPEFVACPECFMPSKYVILRTAQFYFDSCKNVTSDLFGIGAGQKDILNEIKDQDRVYAKKHSKDQPVNAKDVDSISPDLMASCMQQAGCL